jgi:AraC-like DNA-binding protein
MDCGELCNAYRVNVLLSGRTDSTHQGSSLRAGPGTVAVYQPEGHTASRWAVGSRILGVKIDRWTVDDALSEALGRQVRSQVDFGPVMPTTAAARGWISMLMLLYRQLSGSDNLLNQPLVGLPFVDSLVRGFLFAADHPQRDALATQAGAQAAPRTVRAAIDIIEDEAHLPLTVSELAARSHVSVRSLQQGFRRHLGVSPMTYLREVRLRKAHQTLLESDPSAVTVTSVAQRWGFTNPGRFAAAHANRYAEAPSETLHRRAFPRRGVVNRS